MIWLGWTGTMTTTTRPLMVRVRALEWSPLYLEMLKSLMELSREDFAQCWSTLARQSLFCRSGSSRLSWDTNLMFSWLYVSLRTLSDRQANPWSLLVRWKQIWSFGKWIADKAFGWCEVWNVTVLSEEMFFLGVGLSLTIQWRIQDSSDRGAQDKTSWGCGGRCEQRPEKFWNLSVFKQWNPQFPPLQQGTKLCSKPLWDCKMCLVIHVHNIWRCGPVRRGRSRSRSREDMYDWDMYDHEIFMIEICMIEICVWDDWICMIEICVIEIWMIMRYVWLRNVQSLETGSTRSMRLECLVANLSMTLPCRGMPLCTKLITASGHSTFKQSSRIGLRRSYFT